MTHKIVIAQYVLYVIEHSVYQVEYILPKIQTPIMFRLGDIMLNNYSIITTGCSFYCLK